MLDRVVTVRFTGPPSLNAGIPEATGGFRVIAEPVAPQQVRIIDVYFVAMGSDGKAAIGTAISATWLSGSQIRWPYGVQLQNTEICTLNRNLVWTDNTISLRYGITHRNGNDSVQGTLVPSVSTPAWSALNVPYGTYNARTRAVTGGQVASVAGVKAASPETMFNAWALKLEEVYARSDVTAGSTTVSRVTGAATFRMRPDDRIGPFATLIDGDDAWTVAGVQRGRSRASYVDVECTRELER